MGGAPSGASLWGRRYLSHTITQGAGRRAYNATCLHARLTRPVLQTTAAKASAHRSRSHTGAARLLVTAAHRHPQHSEHLHSQAHTVTQAHSHRHELAYIDTQRLPILPLLGPERDSGGHGVHPPASGHDHFTWSRQNWLLTNQSLPSEHLTAQCAPCLHT